ncbi:hypothetical protein GGR54DRAFT_569301 [Hypoxylon sp. NC1633]|nr:hypothetical protein GGR54DRAFT_569301 [Hypoxylon sp. NC1633]
MGQSFSRFRQRSSARTLLELRPSKTPGQDQLLPDLDSNILFTALGDVAKYVHKKGGNETIIAVRGAINTMYLHSRPTTHDLDFFNNRLTREPLELLRKGARKATQRSNALQEGWFNNRTVLFIPKDQRDTLTEEAFDQGVVIFSAPGLTVLAAPWQYAFCAKVDRLAGGGLHAPRPYDLPDATQYMNQYLYSYSLTSVPSTTVETWFTLYSLRWTESVKQTLHMVNAQYRLHFGIQHDIIAF